MNVHDLDDDEHRAKAFMIRATPKTTEVAPPMTSALATKAIQSGERVRSAAAAGLLMLFLISCRRIVCVAPNSVVVAGGKEYSAP